MQVYDLYVWLSLRMSTAFKDRIKATEIRNQCGELIETGLDNLASVAGDIQSTLRRGMRGRGGRGRGR